MFCFAMLNNFFKCPSLVHKGAIVMNELMPNFICLLKREEEHVNVVGLIELLQECSEVFDVCWRLKNAQDRIGKNPKLLNLRSRSKVTDHSH